MANERINDSYTVRRGGHSVEVRGEPIDHDLDERRLGEGPARAIRDAIVAGIRAIGAQAAPATIAKRQRRSPPSSSTTLFNDTGHLADGMTVDASGEEWAIAAPPDRFGPAIAREPGRLEQMLIRLRELVPAIADPMADPRVRAAVERSVDVLLRRRR